MSGFEAIPSSESGVTFNNYLTEDEHYNSLFFESIYNGAGVGILDVDNDGNQDFMLISNQSENALYLNKGNFEFENIAESAGVLGGKEWSAGVTIADVNADGYDDIYVSCHLLEDPELRRNRLYINNKDKSFTEKAGEYGIDDTGYSIHASFFDYDLDGDLDLFVINQPMILADYQKQQVPVSLPYSSRLYKCMSPGQFQDVTEEAGLLHVAFSLSASIGDINNDGWPDIYLANDYNAADLMLLNRQNGTFVNTALSSLRHTSQFAMGSDLADINNDGWLDLMVADMVAEDHYRNKANMGGMNPKLFWEMVDAGQNYQYMFNSLQINNGNGSFSEIAQMAGVSHTDWSWAPLFGDFDNDGLTDLYITNGYLRDIRNRDYDLRHQKYLDSFYREDLKPKLDLNPLEFVSRAPSVPLKNYMFRNDGKLHFDNVTEAWKMREEGFSQGAAYADLDNDGDLDLVVNNMQSEAFVYRNKSVESNGYHYLRIALEGNDQNIRCFGARALVFTDGKVQMQELTNVRGYMSSCEPVLHFGLGKTSIVDSVIVRWPGGKKTVLQKPKVDRTIHLKESKANEQMVEQLYPAPLRNYTREVSEMVFSGLGSQENRYDDFRKEVLIPHKMSTLGPAIDVGDVNGDGREDFFLSGAAGFSGQLFLQNAQALFTVKDGPWKKHAVREDTDVLLYDMDVDGDLDIYVCSGSNEFAAGSARYGDRLYRNQSNADFEDVTHLLPNNHTSSGGVSSGDINGDGFIDLFIGGRQFPGKYGKSVGSTILCFDGKKYRDATSEICPEMKEDFGMVSCSAVGDLDGDQDMDLVVGGEWMPIKVYINEEGKLQNRTEEWGCASTAGWWNTLRLEDIDKDEDLDILAGNLGLNTKFKATQEKPMYVYVKDFDNNGSWDTYLAKYDITGRLFPVRGPAV